MISSAVSAPAAAGVLRVGAMPSEGTSSFRALPFVVEPRQPGQEPGEVFSDIDACVREHLDEAGALLFRGFNLQSAGAFKSFVSAFGDPLLNYEFGSTPRSELAKGVYTSTEYPAHQHIPLHNEQSYTRRWPLRIWFHCVLPAVDGGSTPIADSRRVYNKIDPVIRRRFIEKGLMYVRNSGNGLDVPWQQVFNTSERGQVEAYCRANQIAWDWKDDGELRTRQICQAAACHPRSGAKVWFNQAHLFHISALEQQLRETLLDVVDEENLPRNVYYGDGSVIEDGILDEIRSVLDSETISFPWRRGDILMLDNMLVAHGRAPFTGPRKVVVAMAQDYGA